MGAVWNLRDYMDGAWLIERSSSSAIATGPRPVIPRAKAEKIQKNPARIDAITIVTDFTVGLRLLLGMVL
jgi:hypothetical protein